MLWLWMACSNQDVAKMAQDEMWFDTGVYGSADTGVALEDDADAAVNIEPSWMKLSIDVTSTLDGPLEIAMKRDLYTEDMTWICQQELDVLAEINLTPFLSETELALTLGEPTLLTPDCGTLRADESLELMVGELLSNVAVATEVTHWMDEDYRLETEEVWGAYVQLGGVEDIWAFGIAMHPNETDWLIRTVYSLPW